MTDTGERLNRQRTDFIQSAIDELSINLKDPHSDLDEYLDKQQDRQWAKFFPTEDTG